MAVILKTQYLPEASTTAVLYVDSINSESYMSEMLGIATRFIRENSPCGPIVKSKDHMAKDKKDITTKKDGMWIVPNGTSGISVYKKRTNYGYIYNTSSIDLLFDLIYTKCSKVVPQVYKTTSLFDDFKSELADRVGQYKDRANVTVDK
jgi:hypothetical protein